VGLVFAGICAVLLCALVAGTAYWEAQREPTLTPRQRGRLFLTASTFAFLPLAVLCAGALAVILFSGYCEEASEDSCVSDSLWALSIPLLLAAAPFAYLTIKSLQAVERGGRYIAGGSLLLVLAVFLIVFRI
jgi:hypothetical protein